MPNMEKLRIMARHICEVDLNRVILLNELREIREEVLENVFLRMVARLFSKAYSRDLVTDELL